MNIIRWWKARKARQERIRQFAKEWYEWATSGADPHPVFNRYTGLCNSYANWKGRYESLGFSRRYPFGGGFLYGQESGRHIIHLNPQRLAWAKKKAGL